MTRIEIEGLSVNKWPQVKPGSAHKMQPRRRSVRQFAVLRAWAVWRDEPREYYRQMQECQRE